MDCIPSYWEAKDGNAENRSYCPTKILKKLPDIYRTLNDGISEKTDLRTGVQMKTRGSRNRMLVIAMQDEIPDQFDNGSTLTIKIRYITQSYQHAPLIIFTPS